MFQKASISGFNSPVIIVVYYYSFTIYQVPSLSDPCRSINCDSFNLAIYVSMVLEETPSILLALHAVMVLSASISINNFTVLKLLPLKSFSEVSPKFLENLKLMHLYIFQYLHLKYLISTTYQRCRF